MKTLKLSKSLWPLCLAAGILLTALPASAQLIHRYSFNEPPGSTAVIDSVGGANGVARALSTSGGSVPTFDGAQATLDGSGGYIDLPNGLVSSLTNITIETWITWTSGGQWCRIFDFGTSSTGEDPDGTVPVGTGGNYMFLTATAGTTPRFAITAAAPPGNGGERPIVNAANALSQGEEHHMVVTFGPAGARLFVDGNQVGSGNYSSDTTLSNIVDVNVWLGRANWPDPFFGGSFNEFRMHGSLLTQLQILASKAAGPNTINYTPESPTSITLVVNSSMTTGTTQAPDINAIFPTYGAVILGAQEATVTSSSTNIVAVDAGNVLRAVAPGTVTITALLLGQNSSASITVIPPVVFTALKHRYSFNEPNGSITINDSVGGAAFAGTVNAPIDPAAPILITNGVANFPAGGANATAPYISLPPNMISAEFTNITMEFWFTWNGPANGNTWARVFDFGSSLKDVDPRMNAAGLSYITFSPRNGGGRPQNEFRASADNSTAFVSVINSGLSGFPVGREVHVVSTFAPSIGYSALYIDGIPHNIGSTPLVGTPPTAFQLKQMVDPNIWLGVSQWNDPPLSGQLNELRIYEGVLDEMKIALDRKAGPNALPVSDPGTLQSISLQVSPLYINNPATAQAVLLGDYQNVTGVDITSFNGVQLQSSDTNVFNVTALGAMSPVSVGTASLTAIYKTFSTTSSISVLAPASLSVTNLPATVDAGSFFTVRLFADFAGGISNVNVTAFTGVTRSSSDTSVATISGAGVVTVMNPGVTIITSTYSGLTNTATLTVATPTGFVPGTLIHRYSFSESKDTATVKDSVGTANGEVVILQYGLANGNFTGTGQFLMGPGPFQDPPTTNAYINLPNGLISSLSSVTVEGWFTWFGGSDNQRIFDFGMSSYSSDGVTYLEDGVVNPGRSYFFLSPQTGRPRFAMKRGTEAETPSLQSPTTITITASNSSHFAIVYDQPRGVVRLYVNGQRAGTAAATLPLSVVDDRNAWIGRSQWQDPYFNGSIDEFRIYNGPMLDSDIAAHFAAGPDTLPQPETPAPSLSAQLVSGMLVITWPSSATGYVLETTGALGTTWTAVSTTPVPDGANLKVSVPATSGTAFYRLRK